MPVRTGERLLPDLAEREETRLQQEWIVVVLDNPVNTWDEVILILQKATGCSLQEAENETWEVHHTGRSVVHHGDQDECERAASIIRTIGIDVLVEPL